MNKVQIPISSAEHLCVSVFEKLGYSTVDSQTVTHHLVDAELCGHPFAGLARVLSIAERLTDSSATPTGKLSTSIEVTRETPISAQIDGHDTLGYIVDRKAMTLGIEKAKNLGLAAVGANRTWYTGMLSYYAEMATREDLVVILASNGPPVVAPYGGYEARFCTNPICIGFPTADKERPVIWDIATGKIMLAQLVLAQRLGIEIPTDVTYDARGEMTMDPSEALKGAMAVWGGRKGSGLTIAVQLLGVLAVLAVSEGTMADIADIGFLAIVIDPKIFRDVDELRGKLMRMGRLSGARRHYQGRMLSECHLKEVRRREGPRKKTGALRWNRK